MVDAPPRDSRERESFTRREVGPSVTSRRADVLARLRAEEDGELDSRLRLELSEEESMADNGKMSFEPPSLPAVGRDRMGDFELREEEEKVGW